MQHLFKQHTRTTLYFSVHSFTEIVYCHKQLWYISDIDDCSPNPCENSGACTDLVNAFQCACTPGYTGDTCRPGKNGGFNSNINVPVPLDILAIHAYLYSLKQYYRYLFGRKMSLSM